MLNTLVDLLGWNLEIPCLIQPRQQNYSGRHRANIQLMLCLDGDFDQNTCKKFGAIILPGTIRTPIIVPGVIISCLSIVFTGLCHGSTKIHIGVIILPGRIIVVILLPGTISIVIIISGTIIVVIILLGTIIPLIIVPGRIIAPIIYRYFGHNLPVLYILCIIQSIMYHTCCVLYRILCIIHSNMYYTYVYYTA